MRDDITQTPGSPLNWEHDYVVVEKAIEWLRRHAASQPSLDTLSSELGLSPFQLQKLFSRWAGVSPKRFLQILNVTHARALLARSQQDVLGTSLELGLSSPGRLHDLFVTLEAVSPGEFQRAGGGVAVGYGFHDTPLGPCLIGITTRGICYLEFSPQAKDPDALPRLQAAWPEAQLKPASEETGAVVRQIFTRSTGPKKPFHLLVQGTNFQVQVWRALLRIPAGQVVSYARVAEWAGHPTAHRATGTAVGQNPIAYLIPCHRVLRTDGHLGGYRWGLNRKVACLAWEQPEPT